MPSQGVGLQKEGRKEENFTYRTKKAETPAPRDTGLSSECARYPSTPARVTSAKRWLRKSLAVPTLFDHLHQLRINWKHFIDQDLAAYWQHSFSWRRIEKEINVIPQYVIRLNDIALHFAHCTSPQPNAIPLLFIHGWPGSFLEVLKLIPLLTGK